MKRLNKEEYWLLDLVHRGSFPLRWLLHPDLELIANRDGHGLSQSDLLDRLDQLFQEGSLICVQYPQDETMIEIIPTYQEINTALKVKDDVQYRLTTKGGDQWEALSNPDWSWFIDDAYGDNEATICAKSRQVAEQYLPMISYFDAAEVIPGSVQSEVLSPWQATYWKTLPEGYKLSARTRKSEIKLQRDMSPKETIFINKVYNWYTNPFKDECDLLLI